MAGIGAKNTKPELMVRSAIHSRGFRYSLHSKSLPGKPDLKLNRYNAAIFVNGCFWHGHDCHLFRLPKTRAEFWRAKIHGNRTRDRNNQKMLLAMGWRVLNIWECALKGKTSISHENWSDKIVDWLNSSIFEQDIRGTDCGIS